MEERLWEVVALGELCNEGVPVQVAQSTLSAFTPERLAGGAWLREHGSTGGRIFFEKVSGEGPHWGWVTKAGKEYSLELRTGQAEVEPEQAPEGTVPGQVLDVRMTDADRGFSYQGYPPWVPEAAAVARLLREGQPYLPTMAAVPEKLAGLHLAPFKQLNHEELFDMSQKNLPGCIFGLRFPHTAEQFVSEDFGAEWLTTAFRSAGTLPGDNEVTKILRCSALPNTGVDTPGAGAMKAVMTVEYLKSDPALHADLFIKYPYDCAYDSPLPFVRYSLSLGADDHDGKEIAVNLALPHLFPFRTPKVYFCDICRETTSWLLIQERIPYMKPENEQSAKPFEILPACCKYRDHLLPDPAEYYCALFRKMGQLAAWDKLGRFDGFFGFSQPYGPEQFLATLEREPQPALRIVEIQWETGSMIDKAIDFVLNAASRLVPPGVCDELKLESMKEDILGMSLYLSDFTNCYQFNDSNYIALTHPGCTTDNAFFWRDEYGDLDCGLFDWGAFHRHPFCMWLDRCINIVDPDMLKERVSHMLQCFIDEYHRCGGPLLPLQEVSLRFHVAYVQSLLEDIGKLDIVYWETSREEFQACEHISDELFQSRYKTRVFTTMLLSKIAYFVTRGGFKSEFYAWCAGDGKPYLTPYF